MKTLPGQLSLFREAPSVRNQHEEREAVTIPAADPNVRDEDRPRLSKSNLAVLRRLREGPASTLQLMGGEFGIRPSARVFDLKKAGCDITETRIEAGVALYTLIDCPEELIQKEGRDDKSLV